MTEKVGDMDMHQLRRLIEQVVDERMRARLASYRQKSDRPIADLLAAMRENIWVPPPGTKSSLEMLREDRDA
ncbi:MAG TPA: hypothetical protein PK801_15460 [Aggregatilineales bacterium]|nr:hypothetical protein [Chloroflexota bacterium]HOA23469.1 hypothetical protein [Aggregatilineales bacterium]HPV06255.1 hypothetical protein [Aggregatilineales bacterium]HQA69721.1 hypothetical protein [Aggregatilineales bacterium]HQE18139.1 hypothetical protein [Aggregatilineales bacterium]